MAYTNRETDQVLVEEKSNARILTLNRPKQLNALTSDMGKGRAFCAGGDVATLVRDSNQGDRKAAARYFRKSYTMMYVIATYSKPQVSILNGLVMGGGGGVSIHGRFRVATENTLFAMPETALGQFPESYYLSRLTEFYGEYVGLTGARLDGAEMLACGLATHFVPSERLPMLEEALVRVDSSDPDVISSVIADFTCVPNLISNSAYQRLKTINKCFSRRTIEKIVAALESEDTNDNWISSTIQSLKKASPTSLKVSLRSIREGRLEGIDKCLVREFRISCHAMRGDISKDHFEGCRAILIDKDKNPKWHPSKIESVSDEMVDSYFLKIDDDDDWEDLKLTVSSNLPAYAIAKL
ncbi:3-hydroxyisobutyryl-CoA hydrolase 1 [Castilleja foliolosa]|uniref:3-hydroxyisobutyryl-CoA hydrolase n=1 Tax=Castilleja foliolosa TaxID=1961234 RepID=A0ABD3C5D8_9LAMI